MVLLDHSPGMELARAWVFGAVGVVLIACGIWLYASRKGREGQTQVQILGISLTTTNSSLALVVLGVGALMLGFSHVLDAGDSRPGSAGGERNGDERPASDPTSEAMLINSSGVEAMRGGNYERARAFFRQVLQLDGIEGHRYEAIAHSNLGYVAFLMGDHAEAQRQLALGQGPGLSRVLKWDAACTDGDGAACVKLGDHYRKIHLKNTVAYRAMGSFAHRHYARGCTLEHPASCDARDALAALAE